MVFVLCCVIATACNNAEKANTAKESDTPTNKEKQESVEQKQNNQNERINEKGDSDKIEIKNSNKKMEKVEAKYKVSDVWSIVPIDDQTNEKVALITIDDAPDKYALEMAHTLKRLHVNAIFFVNGHLLETPEKKDMLKQIYDMGFIIGNHTYSHAYLPDLSEEKQKEEIVRVNDMVEKVIGERPKFFRAPNGANTDYTRQVAKDEDMTLMNWSYGYDWHKEYMSKEALTNIMLNTNLLGSGANLLMHDREWTAAALEDIVNGLRDKGYELVNPKLIQTAN